MRYAGAKHGKGWNMENWYKRHLERISTEEPEEVQFIIELADGTLIGESGCGKVRSGWKCRGYASPSKKRVVMTDVKLLPRYWGKGYGTESMKMVVNYLFTKTQTDMVLVPPHKDNIAAMRAYEKSGFHRTNGVAWHDHLIYEIARSDFERKTQSGSKESEKT